MDKLSTNRYDDKTRGLIAGLIINLADTLHRLKNYHTAYRNPQSGKLLVKFEDNYYVITATPIKVRGDESMQSALDEYNFIFND